MRIYRAVAGLTVAALLAGAAVVEVRSMSAASAISAEQTLNEGDGQHDFDFEIGTWKTLLKRLKNPLTGSTAWVKYRGTTVVRKSWNGRANLVKLDGEGPSGRIQGLSLRLYNPH